MKRIKAGVNLVGLQPQMFHAWDVADNVYGKHDVAECWLTEGMATTGHRTHSLHYIGYAIDLRIRNIEDINDKRKNIADLIRFFLGEQYDVILEPTHIHVEFQP